MHVFWASIEIHMGKGSRLHPVFPSVCQAGQIIEAAAFPLGVSLLTWGLPGWHMPSTQPSGKEGKKHVWAGKPIPYLLEVLLDRGTPSGSPPTTAGPVFLRSPEKTAGYRS